MARVSERGAIDRAEATDRELRRKPIYSIGAIDPRDESAVAASKTPSSGKGARCERCRDAEATRWAGAWRCGTSGTDGCPAPATPPISPDIDPAGRDPRRRWPWTVAGGSSRHERHRNDPEELTA